MNAMSSEIVPYAAGQADVYRPQIMTPEAARALDEQVRMCTRAVLREGTDYGIIPGTSGDKVLFRPGAQKLLQWFGLGFTCKRTDIEHDDEGRKHGITYEAQVFRRLPDGSLDVKATCEGTADYDESKFYQSEEQVKARLREQEHKWAAKDRRPPNADRWNGAREYRADWNALMKRAQKRAIVGAVIDATAAGGIFKVESDNDSSPAAATPPDGGPSWYQQALGEATAIATKEDGDELCNAATRAVLAGIATPGQATHVKNRVAQRLRQLGNRAVVDVEDLAEATAARGLRPPRGTQTAPPAPPQSPPAAVPPASPVAADGAGGALPPLPGEEDTAPAEASDPAAGAAPDSERHRKLAGIVRAHFKRLGYRDGEDDAERLTATAVLAGVKFELQSTNELDEDELKTVADTLAKCRNRDALAALIVAADKAQEAADGQ